MSSMNTFAGGLTTRVPGSDVYRNPHASYAANDIPLDFRQALLWCQHVFENNGTYRQACQRIISYFLTDIDIGAASAGESVGDDEKEKWTDFINQLDVIGAEYDSNMNVMAYGNDFASLNVPFRRYLSCPKCATMVPLKVAYNDPQFAFRFSNYEFNAKCPRCSFSGVWDFWDEPENQPDKIKIKFWSPHEIYVLHDWLTNDTEYLWRIPEDYKNLVRQGKLFTLERVSKQVLKAIKHNMLFRFEPGVIYHSKEPTIAGIKNRGWGLSRLMINARQIWYIEMLQRYNEAIALDYVIPMRIITPTSKAAGGEADDMLRRGYLGDAMQAIRRMISFRRRNPTAWNTLPFPVEMQQFGGDAQKLAPSELLNQGYETLLNAIGTPIEMYKGTLQVQAAPVSMRLFEANNHHIVHRNNKFLSWLVDRSSQILSWEPVTAKHQRVKHADDMQTQMSTLQMAMGGSVSQTTAHRQIGLDWRDEQRNIMEEARFQQEQQARMQEEMDQTAFGQQIAKGTPAGGGMPGQPMPPGGQPGGQAGAPAPVGPDGQLMSGQGPVTQMLAGPQTPQTPEDMMATAESIANQLLGLPNSQKLSELRMLRQKNQALHAMVKSMMDQIRSSARSQGGTQLMQQQYGA